MVMVGTTAMSVAVLVLIITIAVEVVREVPSRSEPAPSTSDMKSCQ